LNALYAVPANDVLDTSGSLSSSNMTLGMLPYRLAMNFQVLMRPDLSLDAVPLISPA
jgi:hypothetical protein